MQRWTWTLALLGLCGGLGVTTYLQSDAPEPPADPTQAMLESLLQEVGRLQGELELSRARLTRLDQDRAQAEELGARIQRLETDLFQSGEKLAIHKEHIESSSREAVLQAVGMEFDSKWEGLRGQVDEVFGLARQHEGALRELRSFQQRDTTRMWSELLGPTVQLSGDSTVGSGVLLPSIPVDGERHRTYLLTAWHVVRDIQSNPRQPHDPVPVRVYHSDGTRSNLSAKLLVHDATIDAALLLMDSDEPFAFGARLAGREHLERVAIFASVYAVGCPLGNDPIPTFGEVADIRHQVDGEPYWMISAPTYIGNSGGGIFDAETFELIGLFSKIYTHGTLRPTVVPHMGLVTPLSRIYEWLSASGYDELVPTEASKPSVGPRDSLLYTTGPRATEGPTVIPTTQHVGSPDVPSPLRASLAAQPSRD